MDRAARAPRVARIGLFHPGRLALPTGHYVYLARCADGTYYCGYAVDPVKRVQAHNTGKGARILRGKLPVRLTYMCRLETKGEALRFELALKSRSHAEKQTLSHRWKTSKKS